MNRTDWINRAYRDVVNIHWKRAVVLPALQEEVVGKLYDDAREDLELRIQAIRQWAIDKRKAIQDSFPHATLDLAALKRDKGNQTVMLDRLLSFMDEQDLEAMGVEDPCPHFSTTRFEGCGGRGYDICDNCEQITGKLQADPDGCWEPAKSKQVTGKCVTCRVILHVGDMECPGCHRKLGASS